MSHWKRELAGLPESPISFLPLGYGMALSGSVGMGS